MKSSWLQHFSMGSYAVLVRSDDKFKGLPAGGLTFMVCTSLLFDNQHYSLANRCGSGLLGSRPFRKAHTL